MQRLHDAFCFQQGQRLLDLGIGGIHGNGLQPPLTDTSNGIRAAWMPLQMGCDGIGYCMNALIPGCGLGW
ncbi:hypothetical protein BTJ49_08420 [Oleiagrimonas sp. MCCC 1A03011]|nr:hypothetical protein BTJ49_08420 [Oleiagrimonas sp. MCCC 1A03011]